MTWNMARKLKIMEYEKLPLDVLKNDENTEKREKRGNAQCRTQNMVRKLKITENEKYTLQDVKYGEEKRKMWNIQKCPLQDVKYGKNTENHGK